ncbi:PREDICTED: hydroxyacylglutathione hydrolase cytoplasmic-like [Amphimedon queenslandica]|uniref:Metallo-beta-lactamase domain-containing protein n=1 Tax=Amphimedon queenslandica TaxID=400682 RepID=A0A1X7VPM0_AMPQE|nr:PREDICTED: hydroxyacylglutathione hydrolase cytoplasmic-like [Amphimedon queenslandica]|eukprot:XP_003383354.2 PREDICTED: hydroxyacylglutathione hydrolase cytoplasmic-like [Amphimedon queenslandica]
MAVYAWTVCACLSLLIGGYYMKKSGLLFKLGFPIGYFLYAKTSLGYFYHQKRVKKRPASSAPHSKVEPVAVDDSIVIYPVPYLEDNYAYLVVNEKTKRAVAVDPAHHAVLLGALEKYGVTLVGVLVTHKHWDHAGGNYELRKTFPHVPIYGGRKDLPAGTTHFVDPGVDIFIEEMNFHAIWTPGHTVGHIVYFLKSTTPPCLFSGDHLFIGGCGKIFEDNPEVMFQSLQAIKELPSDTLIFPGHEYSWSNLQFALIFDPHNVNVQKKLDNIKKLRLKRQATAPAVLSEELQYNPFLRTDSVALKETLKLKANVSQVDVLRKLRQEKDKFKAAA